MESSGQTAPPRPIPQKGSGTTITGITSLQPNYNSAPEKIRHTLVF